MIPGGTEDPLTYLEHYVPGQGETVQSAARRVRADYDKVVAERDAALNREADQTYVVQDLRARITELERERDDLHSIAEQATMRGEQYLRAICDAIAAYKKYDNPVGAMVDILGPIYGATTTTTEPWERFVEQIEAPLRARIAALEQAARYAYEAQFEGWYEEERPTFNEWVASNARAALGPTTTTTEAGNE